MKGFSAAFNLSLFSGLLCPALALAQASSKVTDPFLNKGLVDSAVQSSQHILYSPIVSCLLFLSIIGIFVGIGLHHGKTIVISLFVSAVILFGRYFSDTIFTSFQVFQLSFIGPVFFLVLFGKFVSTYLKHKAEQQENQEDKKNRERYHQVQSRSTLRKESKPAHQGSNMIVNPITGQSKSQTNKSPTPNISVAVAGGSKLTRPF